MCSLPYDKLKLSHLMRIPYIVLASEGSGETANVNSEGFSEIAQARLSLCCSPMWQAQIEPSHENSI